MKKYLQQNGFTLAEMLVSVAVFVTVSSIIITALVTSLRTNKKSESLIALRQNGDAAMAQMVRAIRYAGSLDDPDDCVASIAQSNITITSSSDYGQTTFSCPADREPIASNGAAMMDATAVAVSSCSFSCYQRTINDPPTITIQFALDTLTSSESGFLENNATVPFQTSVTMRNFSK